MIKIGDKVDISNGYAFKSSKYVEQGIRVVRITNVQKGEIQDDNPKFYSSDTKEELKSYLINEGDILMSLTGNVGRVGVFPKEFCPAYLNQRVARIRVKSQDLFQKYLFYMLNSKFFERDAIFNSSGIAQLNLSTKWVSEYKIPLPPLDQQKKIAAILDAADDYKQKTKALILKYDELTQSLFLDMFGDTKLNPKGWPTMNLFDICDEVIDCPHSTPKYVEKITEYPCIRTTELDNGNINWSKMKYLNHEGYIERTKRLIPKAGDVIYGREGTFGEAAIVPEGYKMSLGQRVMLFRPKKDIMNSIFFHAVIRSKGLYHQALRVNSGSTVGHVNVKDIKKFKLIKAPLSLQNQFAGSVQAIEAQKAQAQESLAKAEDLFNSLLQKAFKGELTS